MILVLPEGPSGLGRSCRACHVSHPVRGVPGGVPGRGRHVKVRGAQ